MGSFWFFLQNTRATLITSVIKKKNNNNQQTKTFFIIKPLTKETVDIVEVDRQKAPGFKTYSAFR